jgi:hypothetical protein
LVKKEPKGNEAQEPRGGVFYTALQMMEKSLEVTTQFPTEEIIVIDYKEARLNDEPRRRS